DGTFTDVTGTAIPFDTRCGRGVEWCDYDNDGDADIYVSNYRLQPNFLYRNNGNGTFTDVAGSAGVAGSYHSYGSAWGDYDNDGDFDLIMPNIHDYPRLYRNNGNGTFTEVTSSAGLYIYGEYSAGLWFDYDNDGDLDLYLMQFYDGYFTKLMRNNGNGTFTDVTSQAGVGVEDCNSAIVGDFNNDGFLDLFVNYNRDGTYRGRPRLYKNNGETGYHWVEIETEGSVSNRDGIGTRIEVFTGSLKQIREVMAGGEGGSQHMKRVHFGLGSYVVIDSIVVKWPSGVIDKIYNLPADTILHLVEGSTNLKEVVFAKKAIKKINIFRNKIEIKIFNEKLITPEVSLINSIGEKVKTSKKWDSSNLYIYPIKEKFKRGVYFIQLKDRNFELKEKIFIF
ncbi:MAG: FG-GAP-like repeat-containing protein, partial [candidate division WOR-3 bacterium]